MFSTKDTSENKNDDTNAIPEKPANNMVQSGGNYYSMYNENSLNNQYNDTNPTNIDKLLEDEQKVNKNESWNKLDNIAKKQKLRAFADHYGNEHHLIIKEVKNLKTFFNDAIQKNKLKRTKDVQYNKETGKITSIPSLFFNKISRNFTLRNNEKRVSTLKSLTPKRVSNKNKVTIPEKDKID